MFPPSHPEEHDPDAPVRQTDSDAAAARLSAVQKGYLHDPFVRFLVPRPHLQPARPPLINVGTFVRTTAIDTLVHGWLALSKKQGTQCQIISLGAGSDTRFWRLSMGEHKDQLASYVELDFPEITSKKAMSIRKSKELSAVLGNPEDVSLANGGTTLHAPKYHLIPTDLRLPPDDALKELIGQACLDSTLPTLLIFECVLVYSASSSLIQWFANQFTGPLGTIVYEIFGLKDAFGRVMLHNLQVRVGFVDSFIGSPLHSPVPVCKTSGSHTIPNNSLASLTARFTPLRYTSSQALTLRDIRRSHIPPSELERTAKLEMLDEIEELELVLQHYAITWGVKTEVEGWNTNSDWRLPKYSNKPEED